MLYFRISEKVIYFKIYHEKIESQTMISSEQNFENEVYKVGFVLLKIKITEKFKLKVKLTETKY